MAATFSFEQLMAWQKAHRFTILVYQITRGYPQSELFGLTSQFRRAAISIEANIAEGYKKLSKSDKLRFLNISQGSLAECRNYIILSRDLEYIDIDQYEQLYYSLVEASKLLTAYSNGIISNNGIKE
ncbi:MAG: four helix bundle protein [Prevotella sp.]|nr:four helix bundle protein [Prevotella sp.]